MTKRALAGASLALALFAGRASASTYCYTGVAGFSACASANIVVNGGLTQLQIAIQNLSGNTGNTVYALTGFGLYYLIPPNYTGSLTGMSAFTGWVNGFAAGGNAITNPGPATGTTLWVGGAHTSNGANSSLVGCTIANVPANAVSTCLAPATFTFTLSAGANFSLSNLNVALRGQAWDATSGAFSGQSFKCYSSDPNCQPPTTTTSTVPEPATMGLLGTGLVGVMLIGYRRRKRAAQQ